MEPETNPDTSISILFVEDDATVLELQTSILAKRFPDIVMHTSCNGRMGLEQFKIYKPDIVITDINMSVMCGVQMSRAIHAIKPETRFIAITGNSERLVPQISADNKFGFNHVMVKPVYLSELFALVEQCISEIAQRTTSGVDAVRCDKI